VTEETKARLLYAFPTYNGGIDIELMGSVMSAGHLLNRAGISWNIAYQAGGSLIPYVRNNLAAEFMDTPGATHLLFVDVDCIFPPEMPLRLVNYALDGRDVVVCVAPKKETPITFNATLKDGVAKYDKSGLVQLEEVGAAAMLISRHVIEGIIKGEKEALEYDTPKDINHPMKWNLFPLRHEGRKAYGEDYGFCHLAAKHGFEIWADAETQIIHRGLFDYQGSFGDAVRQFTQRQMMAKTA